MILLVLLLLTTFVFADKTSADDSTHNQPSVIELYIDGQCKTSYRWESCKEGKDVKTYFIKYAVGFGGVFG